MFEYPVQTKHRISAPIPAGFELAISRVRGGMPADCDTGVRAINFRRKNFLPKNLQISFRDTRSKKIFQI